MVMIFIMVLNKDGIQASKRQTAIKISINNPNG